MPSFREVAHAVLVKDHMDLQTVARKEEGTEDVEIFL